MTSKWAFIGGMLAGIAGVFTAALVAVELDERKNDIVIEDDPEEMELPEEDQ